MPVDDPQNPVSLAQELIRCPTVTPDASSALDLMETVLGGARFTCHRLRFSESGMPEVDNLFARIGEGHPHLCLVGHVDVVPPGDETAWTHPPFSGDLEDGVLWGRGAVDMKGGIACMTAATLQYIARHGGVPRGSISFLITGDEEGPAVNGTSKVLQWMSQHDERPDHCLLGEPTNPQVLGEMIKIGRRGSLSGNLTISGSQGHVAYPHLANSPMHGLSAVLTRFFEAPLDEGTEHFSPSNLEVTSVDTGNPADNVIPAKVRVKFNIRFNDAHSLDSLKALMSDKISSALEGTGLTHELEFHYTGDCFLTEPGSWVESLVAAISEVTGRAPTYDTGGGTSDARFIKNYCPVVEFGLTFGLIHKMDERVPVADLEQLTEIYGRFLENYFALSDI